MPLARLERVANRHQEEDADHHSEPDRSRRPLVQPRQQQPSHRGDAHRSGRDPEQQRADCRRPLTEQEDGDGAKARGERRGRRGEQQGQ
jgi:hypothetical protein